MIENALKTLHTELLADIKENYAFHNGYFQDMGNYRVYDMMDFEIVREDTERLKKHLYTLIFLEEQMNVEQSEIIPTILDFIDDYHETYFHTLRKSLEKFTPAFQL